MRKQFKRFPRHGGQRNEILAKQRDILRERRNEGRMERRGETKGTQLKTEEG